MDDDSGEYVPDLLRDAEIIARKVMDRYHFSWWRWNDVYGIAREAVVHLWTQEYDPSKGSWVGFVNRYGPSRMIDLHRVEHGRVGSPSFRADPVPMEDEELYRHAGRTGVLEQGYADVDERLSGDSPMARLPAALDCLTEKMRYVIRRHYLDGATLSTIGRELEVTESRICQINSAALLALRVFYGLAAPEAPDVAHLARRRQREAAIREAEAEQQAGREELMASLRRVLHDHAA